MKRPQFGMTLIELMIVVLVIALLASIAIPSYRQYVLRSHRVEAKAALLNLAAAQEKFYLQNNTYATDAQLTTAPPTGLGISDTIEFYTLSISSANATTFEAEAIATGTQLDDQRCKYFSVDSVGARRAGPNVDGSGITDTTSLECWGK